jgi:hypothetical protein
VLTREVFDAGVVASAAITPVAVALVSEWNTGDEFRSCFASLDALGDCVNEIL